MNYPLVSIIIPVYNGSNYLKRAIDSALSQTYNNIEIIVVNDGSDDQKETEKIALSYGEKIRYYKKTNGGVSSALNFGIHNMHGDFFSWLSHDDEYAPDKIRRQVETIKKYSSNTVCYCASCFIDERSHIIRNKKFGRSVFVDKTKYKSKQMLRYQLSNNLSGCALLIPRCAFEECGLFDERLRFCQDSLMWFQLWLHNYNMVYSGYIGVKSRIHSQQLTQNGQVLFHHDSEAMSKILIPALCKKSTKKENFLQEYAFHNAKHGNYKVVEQCKNVARDSENIYLNKFLLLMLSVYGRAFRPFLRKIYYYIFFHIRTK